MCFSSSLDTEFNTNKINLINPYVIQGLRPVSSVKRRDRHPRRRRHSGRRGTFSPAGHLGNTPHRKYKPEKPFWRQSSDSSVGVCDPCGVTMTNDSITNNALKEPTKGLCGQQTRGATSESHLLTKPPLPTAAEVYVFVCRHLRITMVK